MHNEQSLRVVDVLEKSGRGLNLTFEVRDGILEHKSSGKPQTLEGQIVSIADRIAYINHDIEDAIRAGILKNEDLPAFPIGVLGKGTTERIHTAISDIYEHSYGKPVIAMSKDVEDSIKTLRAFMFERVYNLTNKVILERAERMLTELFNYFMLHVDKLPTPYAALLEEWGAERAVCDYISGMTDQYAITVFESIFIPTTFSLSGLE